MTRAELVCSSSIATVASFGLQRPGEYVVAIRLAVSHDQLVVESVRGVIGAVHQQRWSPSVSTSTTHSIGMPVVGWNGPFWLARADRRAVEQIEAEIDEMAEMVPEDVVDPAAPVARGADVDQALDEEPAGDVADFLFAGADAGVQRLALPAKAHGVARGRDLAALLAGGDHAFGAASLMATGISISVCLPASRQRDRLRLVLLAGRADDHDFDLGIGQRLSSEAAICGSRSAGELLRGLGWRPTTVCSTAPVFFSASECHTPIMP